MNTLPLLVLALAFPQDPAAAPSALDDGMELRLEASGRALPGLAWGVEPHAPVVIALGRTGSTPAAWAPTRARLASLGLGVLALAPPDGGAFRSADLELALAHLHETGADTTRVALIAWGDAAPAALDHGVRHPGLVRSVSLLDPRLDAYDLGRLGDWPATSLQLLETGAWVPASGVLAAALPDGPQEWFASAELSGPLGPSDDACTEALAQHLASKLATPDLVVPWFEVGDERVDQPGFVSHTLRLTRTVYTHNHGADAHPRYVLMTYCVGDVFTVGLMTRQPFAGELCFVAGGISGSYAWDTAAKTVGPVTAEGALMEIVPSHAGFRDWHWTQFELPRAIVFGEDGAELMIGFHPTAGETVHLPGNELPFAARLGRR